MRNLTIKASSWKPQALPGDLNQDQHPVVGSGLLSHDICRSDAFLYHRLAVDVSGEVHWYLYALALTGEPSLFVLGVFDTPGQVDFFLALHSDNPLKVPALRQLEAGAGWLRVDEEGVLTYPHYAGIYQVGLKSYLVEPLAEHPGWVSARYADRDHVEYLGEGTEKEMCLSVYSHFDARLRGCKMC
ncbi:MAG: hypothetical protein CMI01_16210 [Oceanospirillaceae bacterium]|jgi:hypothetical protein|uniref:hypothetical protein n=1 Tax=Marinobacterium litorale TaxID=404770 RepID=UPI00047FB096|nr:hypothetical protein [Marinobacterium litorale]MBT00201.1 hypothetical protein [Oceanospirillaceae bacterium]